MQKVCRLCLQPEQRDVTPLFDNVNDDECQRLRLQIADLCSIVILQDENLPKFICCKCNVRLRDAHEFVNLCKKSNDKLHEYYEKNKHCQIREVIKKKEQKSKGRERKYAGKSLRHTRKSLRAYSEIALSSETYNTALSQSTLNVEINSEADDNDGSDLGFKIRETSLNGPVTLDKNVHCNKLSDDNEKQYLCDICNKNFISMTGLRLHLKSHYGIKPYTCQYCDKSFAIPSYKKRHEKIHTGDKHFVCHICSNAFASPNGLKYHLKTHTGEANYHCDTCGKSFIRYKYLKDHIFTHTGEKPYVCKMCDSAYGNSGSLFVHEKKCKSRRSIPRRCLENGCTDNNDLM
ncbi:Zinc finger protein 846 [Formica fusca]